LLIIVTAFSEQCALSACLFSCFCATLAMSDVSPCCTARYRKLGLASDWSLRPLEPYCWIRTDDFDAGFLWIGLSMDAVMLVICMYVPIRFSSVLFICLSSTIGFAFCCFLVYPENVSQWMPPVLFSVPLVFSQPE
jgi:hypothetical protein